MSDDPPYPELKKTHTMAHKGRPWRDYKPPPAAGVWNVIQGFNNYWMLVAAVELNVFDRLDERGPASAETIAGWVDASVEHLRHLLDAMVTLGYLDQIGGVYELTETGERYLVRTSPASMADLVRVSPGPLENWLELAETVRNGRVGKPIDDDIAGFYAPLVEATFTTQNRAAGRLGLKLGWQRLRDLAVLDLGAGLAPWAIAILEQAEASTAVVNDFPEIVKLAEQRVAERGLSDRVSYRPGNFHDIEIEPEHYDIVVLGHLCRTEGPELAPKLIGRAVAGLKPGGTLLVADYFADNDRKLGAFGVQMGMTMLANTVHGRMITNADMQGWLAAQPLERIRLIEPIGFNFVYVASKKPKETGT